MVDLLVREGRLRDGRVVDLAIEDGRVATIGEPGTLDGDRVLPADGRLVTESAVNGHMHLDKVHSLDRVGDDALGAYTGAGMGSAMTAIELARQVKAQYDRSWITPNVRRALVEAVRHGTLHVQAFQLGAHAVGGIPWIEHSDRDAQRHVDWACELAARTGRRVAMLVDDAGDPALRTTEMLALAMLDHRLEGRGVACHARAVGRYERPSQLRLAGLAQRAGLGFVSDPQTGPLHLPVDLFDELGLPVAFGQDDIEDAYYPFGRHSMWEIAFLAAHSLGWLSAASQERLLDLVTTRAADVLGIEGHRLAEGGRADLVVHPHERVVDVLRHHAAPRWVVSRGRVVAATTTTTDFDLPREGAA